MMMNRVSELELNRTENNDSVNIMHLSITDPNTSKANVSPNGNILLSTESARTDLDYFTDDEINAIFQHGYACAAYNCETAIDDNIELGEQLKDQDPNKMWYPCQRIDNQQYNLGSISKRKWRLISFSDIITVLMASYILFAVLLIGFLIFSPFRAATAEKMVHQLNIEKINMKDASDMMRICQVLGEFSLSETNARRDELLHELTELSGSASINEALRSSTFDNFIKSENFKNVEIIAMKYKETYHFKLKQEARKLSQFTRKIIQEQFEEYYTAIRSMHRQWRHETIDSMTVIANDNLALKDLKNSRRRFWRAYFSDYVFVEDAESAKAIDAFAKALLDLEIGNSDLIKPDKNTFSPLILK